MDDLTLNIFGNDKSATAALEGVGKSAEKAGKTVEKSFSQAISEIDKLVSEGKKADAILAGPAERIAAIAKASGKSAEDVTAELRKMSEAGKAASGSLDETAASAGKSESSFRKMGAAIAALGLASFAKSSIEAFAESEQSAIKLQDAFERFPKLADSNVQAIQDMASALASKTRYDDDATASAAATLAQFELTGAQLEELLPLVQDYAAKTGQDLDASADKIGKALLGNTRALKEVGLNYKSTGDRAADFTGIVEGLRQQVGGFAEKEGDTAAGKLEILKNKFGELQEGVGEALLPAFSAMVDAVGPAVDKIAPLAEILGNVVKWIAELPGPVLAAGAAFAAFLKFGPGISKMLTEIRTKGTGAGGALRNIGKGLAVGGAVALVGTLVSAMGTAEEKTKAFRDEIDGLMSSLAGMDTGSADFAAAVLEATRGSESFQKLTDAGVSAADAMDYLTGKTDDAAIAQKYANLGWEQQLLLQEGLVQGYPYHTGLIAQQIEQTDKDTAARLANAEATTAAADAIAAASAAAAGAIQFQAPHSDTITGFAKLRDVISELEQAAGRGQIQGALERIGQGIDSLDSGTGSLDLMAGALQFVADEASDAATQLGYFSLQVDKLAGRSISAEEAAQQLHDQTRALTEATEGNSRALVNSQKEYERTGEIIDTTTEKGSALQDSVQGYREAYDNSVVAAYDAAKANGTVADGLAAAREKADQTRGGFVSLMTQWGLTETQAQELADRVGILDGASIDEKTFGITANDLATGVINSIIAQDIPTKIATIQAQLIGGTAVSIALDAIAAARTAVIRAIPGSAAGGPVYGSGAKGVDSVPTMLAPGEHVLTDKEVDAAGGHGAIFRLRKALRGGFLRRAAGGTVSRAGLAGYSPRSLGDREGVTVGSLGDLAEWIRDLAQAAGEAGQTARESSTDYRAALADYRRASKEDKAGAKKKVEQAAAQMNADKRAADAAKRRSDAEGAVYRMQTRARQVLVGLTQAFDRGSAAVERAGDRLKDARGKLSDLRGDRSSMASGIAGGIAGFGGGILGNADTRRTPAAILAGLRYNLGKVKGFGANLASLKAKGLNAGLLAEIAGGGDDGMSRAAVMAGMSRQQIAQANSLQAQINASAAKSGASVAGAKYDKLIIQQAAAVKASHDALVRLERRQASIDKAIDILAKGVDLKWNGQVMAKAVRQGEKELDKR